MKLYPKRYIPKILSALDKVLQKNELNKSKKLYTKKQYHTRTKISSFKSKPSSHIENAKKIFKIKSIVPTKKLAKKTGCSVKTLRKIMKKGQGAYYSSGSRPNQTAHSWGKARLASALTGGKASAIEYSLLKAGCKRSSKALKLATKAKRIHNSGTRRVPKISIV